MGIHVTIAMPNDQIHISTNIDATILQVKTTLANLLGTKPTRLHMVSDNHRPLGNHMRLISLTEIAPMDGLLTPVTLEHIYLEVTLVAAVVSTTCSVCLRTSTKGLACQGCHSIRYCSRECQTHDWPRHKAACKAAQAGVTEQWEL